MTSHNRASGARHTSSGTRTHKGQAPRPHRSASSASHSSQPHPSEHLPAAYLEAVRERSRITDLFPASSLKRSGRGYLSHCPWHNDQRPSLTISPDRNRVHCFVCNRGADPIDWLMDRQGLSFSDAVHQLAGRYGIPAPQQDPELAARAEAERRERQRLHTWRSNQQTEFHQALLADLDAGGPAAAYLHQRGLSPDTALAWGLGLNGGRLMLPLRDRAGRCCGFSGRTLSGQEPKYRNSANDALFCKSHLLFGLDRAAEAIRTSAEALLVEGPLDVLQLHQAGFCNAVALMGTALSKAQIQELQRSGARKVLIALDGDGAGQQATARLLSDLRPAAISGGLDAAVVHLPAGHDPDELLRREGAEAFSHRLLQASHWLCWQIDQLLAPLQAAPEDLGILQRCEQQARELLAALPTGPLRHRAEQRLGEALGVVPVVPSPARTKSRGSAAAASSHQPEPDSPREPVDETARRAEWRALRLFLCSPVCRDPLACLVIHTPLYRRAQDCLVQVHTRTRQAISSATHGSFVRSVLSLCPRLDPELAHLLQQLCNLDPDLQDALLARPEDEMMAILDVLEPVG